MTDPILEEQQTGELSIVARKNDEAAERNGFTRYNPVARVTSVLLHMIRNVNDQNACQFKLMQFITQISDTEVVYDVNEKHNILIPRSYYPSWMKDLAAICADEKRNYDKQHEIYKEAVEALHQGMLGNVDAANAFIGGAELAKEAAQ